MRLVPLLLALAFATPALAATPLDDDAGSGRDAPDVLGPDAVPVAAGLVHRGAFLLGETGAFPNDEADVYSFDAQAGQLLEVRFQGYVGCVYLHAPGGAYRTHLCPLTGAPLVHTLPESGRWQVMFASALTHPASYAFSLGLDAPAPAPA